MISFCHPLLGFSVGLVRSWGSAALHPRLLTTAPPELNCLLSDVVLVLHDGI